LYKTNDVLAKYMAMHTCAISFLQSEKPQGYVKDVIIAEFFEHFKLFKKVEKYQIYKWSFFTSVFVTSNPKKQIGYISSE
jgi:hypothetical protein